MVSSAAARLATSGGRCSTTGTCDPSLTASCDLISRTHFRRILAKRSKILDDRTQLAGNLRLHRHIRIRERIPQPTAKLNQIVTLRHHDPRFAEVPCTGC